MTIYWYSVYVYILPLNAYYVTKRLSHNRITFFVHSSLYLFFNIFIYLIFIYDTHLRTSIHQYINIFYLTSNLYALELRHIIATRIVQFTLKIMINHRAYGCIGPNVFSGFNHIDNGINRQDDTEQSDWSTD